MEVVVEVVVVVVVFSSIFWSQIEVETTRD